MKLAFVYGLVYATTAYAGYLDGTNRAKLFKQTDNAIPEMYFTMSESDWTELLASATVGGGGFGGFGGWGGGNFPWGGNNGDNNGGNNGGWGGFPGWNKKKRAEEKTKRADAEFEVTNCSLDFVLNGETESFSSVSMKIGGDFSKNSKKLGYNIKITDEVNKNLKGRKVLRLRANLGDTSALSAKIAADILNKAGVPSISTNYAKMYVNGQYLGLYNLVDAYKTSWVKKYYDIDEEITTLYQCKTMNCDFTTRNVNQCTNENDDYATNTQPLQEFITAINAAKSRADVENLMDVDEFVKIWIIEWLIGSWDNSLGNGKNYHLYKRNTDGKWSIMIYDLDNSFNVNGGGFSGTKTNAPTLFENCYSNRYITDILAKNDKETFTKNLQEILDNAYNPDILLPHIAEVKAFIDPYILEDRTPVDGTLPGYVNNAGQGNVLQYNDFVTNNKVQTYISEKYQAICSNYNVDCTNHAARATTAAAETKTKTTTTTSQQQTSVGNCWATALGFNCCSDPNAQVIYSDADGDWGVENNDWCGVMKASSSGAACWAAALGFKCCDSCNVQYVDNDGSWGVENNEWCGITC